MSSTLKPRLQEDMKSCMRSGEKDRLLTIRMILAAIKQREIDERIELDDTQILSVLDRLGKQRRESIAQFEKAARQDLVDKETAELRLIEGYLPEQLSETEVEQLVRETIATCQATTIKDMGKVMAVLKPKLQGRADIATVGNKIKALLG